MDPCLPLNGRITPSRSSFTLSGTVDGRHSRDACTVLDPMVVSLVTPTVVFRDTSAASSPAPHSPGSWCGARSRGVPRESLDAAKNLPKEAPRQVALGQLEHEVPRMPDQPPAGLEELWMATGRMSRRSRLPRL